MSRGSTVAPLDVLAALLIATCTPAQAFGQPTGADPPPLSTPPAVAAARDPRIHVPEASTLATTGGTGLIRLGSPYPLKAGNIAVGATVMNCDRNPGDVDFFDYGAQFAVGVGARTELFVRASPVVRTNSVGQDPVGFPVPPLDLFVDTYPTNALRPGPLFLLAQEVPYKSYDAATEVIDPPGHGAFASSSGSVVLGAKVNLASEDRGAWLGLGVRGYVDIPTETPEYNSPRWGRLNGVSGKVDVGLDVLAAKRFALTELMVNVGYRRVGDPDRGIRLQYIDSSKSAGAGFLVGSPVEIALDLHDRLEVGAGAAIPLFAIQRGQVWMVSEFSYLRYVGGGTPVERLVHPAEMRLGLQWDLPWYKALSLGAAWQLLFNDGGDGDLRTTFLRGDAGGDVNFSELVDGELSSEVQAYLASRGATFSPNSSKVLSTDNPAFDAWRNIAPVPQRVISQGGGNILAFITWRINQR
ncbi:hypothetical protein TBR22_A42190 [Luteitalea sp. TBR-22]|uniref:hypothetical protein n=1 Tax=Luteitalea sp. TBR-22 TaxID=2802971 RepID=UPI001AF53192|nr:hypothetical protein [Luteitalea sp. TBR-22]BCS34993.1 hypothetical protein TBR22_A42190 [Luteitalea sp. TBR-22]